MDEYSEVQDWNIRIVRVRQFLDMVKESRHTVFIINNAKFSSRLGIVEKS